MERFDLDLPVRLSVEDVVLDGLRAGDLSSQGIFVQIDKPFRAGSPVDISVFIPSTQNNSGKPKCMLKAKGKVVRAEKRGIAVLFDRRCEVSPLTHNNT